MVPSLISARHAPIAARSGGGELGSDTVVPIEQSRLMERALKQAGKPVELVVMPGEDHWLSYEATRQAMLGKAVAFVEKYDPAN